MDSLTAPAARFTSGATSTSEKPRYDLIPVIALRRLAARFSYGARKHGDHNYKNGFADLDFIRDRINHMIEHAQKYATGDRSTDHLGAIMCNGAMLAELERLRDEAAAIDQPFGVDLPMTTPETVIAVSADAVVQFAPASQPEVWR